MPCLGYFPFPVSFPHTPTNVSWGPQIFASESASKVTQPNIENIYSCICLFICSFIHLFIHSLCYIGPLCICAIVWLWRVGHKRQWKHLPPGSLGMLALETQPPHCEVAQAAPWRDSQKELRSLAQSPGWAPKPQHLLDGHMKELSWVIFQPQ